MCIRDRNTKIALDRTCYENGGWQEPQEGFALEGTRPRGRPRKRWEDGIAEDAKDMGIRNWRWVAVDRVDWSRRLVEANYNYVGHRFFG